MSNDLVQGEGIGHGTIEVESAEQIHSRIEKPVTAGCVRLNTEEGEVVIRSQKGLKVDTNDS